MQRDSRGENPATRQETPPATPGSTRWAHVADGPDMRRILAETESGPRRLSFAEIVEAGVPAAFCDFGERLVFLDGKLLDAQQPDTANSVPLEGLMGPSGAVGIEFGWRHAGTCQCRFCAQSPLRGAA